MASLTICAVIPGYQEEQHIADVVAGARQHVETVLVVDDGSTDETALRAEQAGAQVLKHETNQGKGIGIRNGLNWAVKRGFDAAVLLDADGQHLTEEIPRFLEAAPQADMLVGNRMWDTKRMPFARYWTNRFTSWVVSRLAGVRVPDSQCGFRLVHTACWRDIESSVLSRNYDFESEMLVVAGRSGYRIGKVPISTIYADEVSKINPVADTIRFFKMTWRLSGRKEATRRKAES